MGSPSIATQITVDPSLRALRIQCRIADEHCSPDPSMCFTEPTCTWRPATAHLTPAPVMFWKSVGLLRAPPATALATDTNSLASTCSLDISATPTTHQSIFLASASVQICSPSAFAGGMVNHSISGLTSSSCFFTAVPSAFCWACLSLSQAESCFCDVVWKAATRTTLGLPFVRVPVLSSTMCVTFEPNSSGTAPLLTRMPFLAATPVDVMTAVGVAKPKAHGQATNRTVSPCSSTKKNLSSSGHSLSLSSRIEVIGMNSVR
mmetsp:Transcript_64079/g.111702  ORF Transcript_64079/g.111702 Transcript_64079/m.111702 type:complete len:262 (+) Transcript_64079:779-1564(+)